jgi:hypothetical protein
MRAATRAISASSWLRLVEPRAGEPKKSCRSRSIIGGKGGK